MKTAALILGLLSLLSVPREGWCRWATDPDAASAVEFDNDEVEVREDGTYREVFEEQTEVLKEQARRDRGARRLYYNSSAGSLKILKAEVINGDSRTSVESGMIEDKPLASHGAGFDQFNQVLIAFPDVKTGSKTHLKYAREVNDVPFRGIFSKRFHLEKGMPTRSGRIRIVSELPLFVETHDPFKVLGVTESRKGEKYVLEINLTKPLHETVVDEEASSMLSSEKTWVVVSSTRSHAEMIKSVLPRYEAILDSKLPEPFARIQAEAAKKEGVVDKINTVTSMLAQTVRYMGDWRTVSGGFVPRSLETIARTQYGDCKDFAASTAAILRRLGMTAEVAWVERDSQPDPLPGLPLGEAFNHAILRAKAGGKVYWVDPTNFQSFAQGIFPDIIGRQSLVLSKSDEMLVDTIPAAQPGDSHLREKFTLEFDPSGSALFEVQMNNSGRMALSMTGASLQFSKESLDHSILSSFVKPSHVQEFKIADYDLKSRIVKDLEFSVHVKTRNSFSRTSAGLGYQLPAPAYVDPLINLEVGKRVSGYFLAQPMTYSREYALKNIRVVGKEYRGCDIQSPWMNIRRSFKVRADGLEVSEGFEIKKARIGVDDLKSAGFGDFQSRLQKCFDRIQIIFTPRGKTVLQ